MSVNVRLKSSLVTMARVLQSGRARAFRTKSVALAASSDQSGRRGSLGWQSSQKALSGKFRALPVPTHKGASP
jgi:predicted pyridoxine 5'-phosphate oxidase superfamily flavin-nucleotide-binding protein